MCPRLLIQLGLVASGSISALHRHRRQKFNCVAIHAPLGALRSTRVLGVCHRHAPSHFKKCTPRKRCTGAPKTTARAEGLSQKGAQQMPRRMPSHIHTCIYASGCTSYSRRNLRQSILPLSAARYQLCIGHRRRRFYGMGRDMPVLKMTASARACQRCIAHAQRTLAHMSIPASTQSGCPRTVAGTCGRSSWRCP